MTDVFSYVGPIIMMTLEVNERIGIYPKLMLTNVGETEQFHQYFPSLVTPA